MPSPTSLAVARWLRTHRVAVLSLWLVAVAIASLGLPRLSVDNGLQVWFSERDPQLQAYRDFQADFGHDEALFVLLPAGGDRVSNADLARLRRVGHALAALPDVAEVRSLATVLLPRSDGDWLALTPLLPAAGDLPSAEAVLAQALADPLLAGTAVTRAGDALALELRLDQAVDDDLRRDAVLAGVRGVLAQHPGGSHVAGVAVLTQALNSLSRSEGARLYGLALGVVVLGLAWVFGRLRPALLATAAVALASAATLGLAGWLGRSLNLVTMVVPTLVMVLGVADCVHLLLAVGAVDDDSAVETGVARVLGPCALTTGTTAVALLSLLTAPMPVLQELGWLSAVGVLLALGSSLVVVTAGAGDPAWRPAPRSARRSRRLALWLADHAIRRPRRALAGVLAPTLLLGAAATTLTVDTDSAALLPADHPVRQDLAVVEAALGGVVPLELTVHDPAGVLRPPLLQAVEAWTAQARQVPGVGWSTSLVPVLQRLERALDPTGPGTVPDDPARLEQALLLYGSQRADDLDRLVRPPDVLRVTLGVPLASARTLQGLTATLTDLAQLPPGATLRPDGYVPLYIAKMDRITTSTVRSFGTSFLAVFLVLAVVLRTPRLLAVALAANALPVAAVLGGLALSGRPLDAATATIAAIVLGLVVDDTVHLLHRTRTALAHHPPAEALAQAAGSTGRALVATTAVLAAGLGVLGTAQAGPIASFGLWSAVALVVALLADLVAVPAGVALWHPRDA